jgi:glutamyl-tRNA reductase
LESTLVIVGVNYRSAPVEVRERFWVSESRRYEALVRLARSEAIEEVAVLATANRTEFILWTGDASSAANSVLSFLTAEYDLRIGEWKHFYRLVGEAAVAHLFKVASGLDSIIVGEPEIVDQLKDAWFLAQEVGTTSRFLDGVFQKALAVSDRVRGETSIGECAVSVPYAAVELARQLFGSLEDRTVVLLGSGHFGEMCAQYLVKYGARSVHVVNRHIERAQDLAEKLGGLAAAYEERRLQFAQADVVITCTTCPHIVFTRDDAEYVKQQRDGKPLLVIDIAVPRDVDPRIRDLNGIFLYDIDDLEQLVRRTSGQHASAVEQANQIVTAEARVANRKLSSDITVPTAIALRERLDDLCRQELEAYRHEMGPFTEAQEDALLGLAKRISSRISGSLARELRELPEKLDQDQLTSALEKLFHLPQKREVLTN